MKTAQGPQDLKSDNALGRFFVAVVKINTESVGMIRCHVPGLTDGVSDGDLPKFALVRPVFRGVSGAIGYFSIPRVGTRVLVTFDGGNIDSGIVMGEVADGNGKPEDLVPGKWGFIDEAGTYIEVVVGSTLKIQHQGALITIDASGNITGTSPTNITWNATTSFTVNAPLCTINASTATNVNSPTLTASNRILDAGGTKSMDSMRGAFNSHVHNGVTPGGGNSGSPTGSM